MNSHTHTATPWILCMDDLTIRSVGSNGKSDCMGDYRGSIIADLKPSLGIEDEDVKGGALDISQPRSYPNGGGARAHAWEEVIANGRAIVSAFNSSTPVRDEVQIPEITDGCAPTAYAYLRHNFGILLTPDEQLELQDAVMEDMMMAEQESQLIEEALDGCQAALDNLSSINYQDERYTAEQIGIAKHILTRLLGNIESYK